VNEYRKALEEIVNMPVPMSMSLNEAHAWQQIVQKMRDIPLDPEWASEGEDETAEPEGEEREEPAYSEYSEYLQF
jgi:hypothetical protein